MPLIYYHSLLACSRTLGSKKSIGAKHEDMCIILDWSSYDKDFSTNIFELTVRARTRGSSATVGFNSCLRASLRLDYILRRPLGSNSRLTDTLQGATLSNRWANMPVGTSRSGQPNLCHPSLIPSFSRKNTKRLSLACPHHSLSLLRGYISSHPSVIITPLAFSSDCPIE